MRAYDVLYDGGCGLCSRTVVWLRRLDLRRRLRFVDFDAVKLFRLFESDGAHGLSFARESRE